MGWLWLFFLCLYFDADGDSRTGCSNQKIAGQQLSGFDVSAEFSTMQEREKDGTISSVLNCQVSKWDGTQFSGDLGWGTQFNSKMSASSGGDYATFAIPRSILEVAPKGIPARIAFEVPDANYVEGKQPVATLKISEK
jgi:hypothetical protein